jgi:hypothetical protein
MLKQIAFLAVVASVLLATVGFAKGDGYGKGTAGQQRFSNQNIPSFEEHDADNDGVITQSEFDSFKEERMIKNAESGKQLRNAGNAPQFSDIDTNKDGKITKDEFQSGQRAHGPAQNKTGAQ